MPVKKITSITLTHKKLAFNENAAKNNVEEVIDPSMGSLVSGVTRIVERIYVITCIRPGWYKLFPQAGHFVCVYNFA